MDIMTQDNHHIELDKTQKYKSYAQVYFLPSIIILIVLEVFLSMDIKRSEYLPDYSPDFAYFLTTLIAVSFLFVFLNVSYHTKFIYLLLTFIPLLSIGTVGQPITNNFIISHDYSKIENRILASNDYNLPDIKSVNQFKADMDDGNAERLKYYYNNVDTLLVIDNGYRNQVFKIVLGMIKDGEEPEVTSKLRSYFSVGYLTERDFKEIKSIVEANSKNKKLLAFVNKSILTTNN